MHRKVPRRRVASALRKSIALAIGFAVPLSFPLVSCHRNKPSARGANLLLITVDTMRADRLGCYGGAGDTSPAIDRLAQQGWCFESIYSPVPLTLPAHASMFTGLLPVEHGVRDNSLYRLSGQCLTLAEVLKAQGYSTAAFVGAFVLDSRFGLSQGFDVYDDRLQSDGKKTGFVGERASSAVTDAALEWAATEKGNPWFAWVHYYDPHYPYTPAPDIAVRFQDRLYEGEIASADAQVDRWMKYLRSADLESRTLVVVTADHGEALNEHDEHTHGYLLYQTTMHVPLVIRHRSLSAGRRIDVLGQLSDLPRTLLGLLEIETPEAIGGRNLAAGNAGAGGSQAYLESELPRLNFGFAPVRGLVMDGWKLIDGPYTELFDLRADPLERENRAAEQAGRVHQMRASLEGIRAKTVTLSEETPDAELKEQLDELGYIAGEGSSPVTREKWQPPDLFAILEVRDRARTLFYARRFDEAERAYKTLTELSPQSPSAWEMLGTALARQGKHAQAKTALEKALELEPGLDEAQYNLAVTLHELGEDGRAFAALKRVIEINPLHQRTRRMLAQIALDQGDRGAALEHVERILEGYSVSPEYLWAQELKTKLWNGQ